MSDVSKLISFSGRPEGITRNLASLIVAIGLVFSMNNAEAEVSVEIAPGLVGVVHEPDRKPVGLVVIAPGAGYDMSQPLMTDAAEQAASAGYRSLRFNWRYVTEGVERGAGIDDKVQDLKDAMKYLAASSEGNDQDCNRAEQGQRMTEHDLVWCNTIDECNAKPQGWDCRRHPE